MRKNQLNGVMKVENCCGKVCLIFLYFSLSKSRRQLHHEVVKRISLFNMIEKLTNQNKRIKNLTAGVKEEKACCSCNTLQNKNLQLPYLRLC